MSSPDLLRPLSSQGLSNDRVVVFSVSGGRWSGPTLLVNSPALRFRLDELADVVERVVFVEDSTFDAALLATIDAMLAALGPEDGLVQFEMAAEAIKLTRQPSNGMPLETPLFISHGVDRSTVVSFGPPEVLRVSALLDALATPPSESWVDPAGLIVANGGRIETYPRLPLTD